MSILELKDLDKSLKYSYEDYYSWKFSDRVELINGQIFSSSGETILLSHQEVLGNIFIQIANYLKGKTAKVIVGPFDVYFEKKDAITILQPDICVICDKNKLDDRGCIGAPDIVVEILSPGNNIKELLNKYQVYEEFGVNEYWVVSQSDQSILIYTLNELGKFQPSKIFTLSEKIASSVLPGFELLLDDVFEDLD
ncbi:Uma2 family endonuclease [Pedobacter frigidisoli]|uniref:Uma2 family endonuclease n=1 Tax=Pedobacter frigidisoli TaxID=2530455 RepID=A0A4R0P2L6_9SPHI|nr:Uma2 family endonuclease [Pedobacter frigidisoli]TCD11054.1 Uma2 family endonuclease [Pedobacter frigidisoli]